MNSLIVKKKNINNKRVSRLQSIILKVLAYAQGNGNYGYYPRQLSRIVAGLYGKGSLIPADSRQTQHIKTDDKPFTIIEKLKSSVATVEGQVTGKTWISPKFSVSFSRALRTVCHKGYFQTYIDEPILTITDKGLSAITGRKVKVNAQFWDLFINAH